MLNMEGPRLLQRRLFSIVAQPSSGPRVPPFVSRPARRLFSAATSTPISGSGAGLIYDGGVPEESLYRYRPGGYHPVHLGDFLSNGRYEVVHKLGFGGYSTVWLARDHHLKRYVAVKIVVSEVGVKTRELHVLRVLSTAKDQYGSRNVIRLLDDFQHIGPNGTHAYIHSGNILFMLSDVSGLSKERLFGHIGAPHIANVSRIDGKPLGPGLPRYQVSSARFPSACYDREMNVKLVDFGEAFTSSDKPPTLHTPLVFRAPEVIFDDEWDHRVDLWSMACTMFELVVGFPMFDSVMTNKDIVIEQMIERVGDLPGRWKAKWNPAKKEPPDVAFLDEDEFSTSQQAYTLEQWLHQTYFDDEKKPVLSVEDVELLGSMLRGMLRYESDERPSAAQVAQHPWFHSGRTDTGEQKFSKSGGPRQDKIP
ncbi:hypothetical protein B0A49_03666 [Cryomyces minteri]|uniref:non-specific serine/threonine protein kinase n=1 Tax=Cryomyces minteri TaxID=331657 RepID=A0A4U0XKR6_9PEZI|nr:hypothetical protein B0A49_03666 [Cryomyces minteri]